MRTRPQSHVPFRQAASRAPLAVLSSTLTVMRMCDQEITAGMREQVISRRMDMYSLFEPFDRQFGFTKVCRLVESHVHSHMFAYGEAIIVIIKKTSTPIASGRVPSFFYQLQTFFGKSAGFVLYASRTLRAAPQLYSHFAFDVASTTIPDVT